ncbi:MAG: ribosomal RNA small subunit methyltransferase A [Candidatus Pacebacteria bacterium]|nr:ribosomal RNA small subunit methyltransferase A [Candidatus Paceibacterota bacterium]
MLKNIFQKYNFRPKKRLGQNFLISEKVLEQIISVSKLKKDDIVLEIGAGTGILTIELANKVKQVIAIEKDEALVAILKKELSKQKIKNVKIIQDDILKIKNLKFIENSKLKIKNYKVISNLPYYITAPVIKMFLENKNPPELMILMVQKEVGERICAKPPKMSKLAIFCQIYGLPEIMAFVSKKCFWPEPKVDSVILKITPKNNGYKSGRSSRFVTIVKAGFCHPRKQLINNFSKGLNLPREKVEKWLNKNNINPAQRAETLTIKNWIGLTRTFHI